MSVKTSESIVKSACEVIIQSGDVAPLQGLLYGIVAGLPHDIARGKAILVALNGARNTIDRYISAVSCAFIVSDATIIDDCKE